MLALVLCSISPEPKVSGVPGVVMKLPNKIEGYTGYTREPSQIELDILPDDTSFSKIVYIPNDYIDREDAQNRMISVGIVLGGADRRSMHRPQICLVGQGWSLVAHKVRTLSIDGKNLDVMDLTIEREGFKSSGEQGKIRAHYVYWWVGKDVSTPYSLTRVLMTAWDNAVRGVNHRWAYPNMMVFNDGSMMEIQGDQDAWERASRVLENVVPYFQKSFIK